MVRWQRDLLPLMPKDLTEVLGQVPQPVARELQEIRMRVGKPVLLKAADREIMLYRPLSIEPYILEKEQVRLLLECMADYSLQIVREQLKQGFLTLPGGYRVGIAGHYAAQGMGEVSGFMVRIAREVRGAADFIMPYLKRQSGARHTLVLSPPGMGKTTLLRDIARQFSNGGLNVSIVDERSEIAGCRAGLAQLDVGLRTDVLDACPKAQGLSMMLRSMSPQLMLCDEVGDSRELLSIGDAAQAGVSVIASAHAASYEEFCGRPMMEGHRKYWPIERMVLLGDSLGAGTVTAICDAEGRPLWRGAWRKRWEGAEAI